MMIVMVLTGPGCCNSYCSPPTTMGCTDSCAANYDPNATVDDGSCMYTACLAWPSTNQYQNCCNSNYYPQINNKWTKFQKK